VLLHVLAHVEADQRDGEHLGEGLGELGLADAGRAGEQERADRLVGAREAGAGPLDRGGDGRDGLILAEDQVGEALAQVLQDVAVRGRDRLGRDAGHAGDDGLDGGGVDGDGGLAGVVVGVDQRVGGGWRRRGRGEAGGRAGLVDDVDRRVGQVAVAQVLVREHGGELERLRGVAHAVVGLVGGLEAAEDLYGLGDGGLQDLDLLEAAGERLVALEGRLEVLVGGRADAAQLAGREGRLEHVAGVHGAARGGAGADDGVDLVDEQDRVGVVLDGGDHGLEALLELAAEAGAGEQGAHVEREDVGAGEGGRDLAFVDAQGQALDDGGLADAGLTDQHRVVLAAPTQDLDDALDLGVAADQQLDAAGGGLGVQVDGVGLERIVGDLLVVVLVADRVVGGAAGRGPLGALGDAVRHEHGRVAAGDAVLAQDVGGEGLALGEDGDQQVGAGDLAAAGALDVEDGALQHATDADRLVDGAGPGGVGGGAGGSAGGSARWGVGWGVGEALDVGIDEGLELEAQLLHVALAGEDHLARAGVVEQGEEQVLEGDVLVAAALGVGDRGVDRVLEFSAQHRGPPRAPLKRRAGSLAGEPACVPGRPSSPRSRACRLRRPRSHGCGCAA
jgi:hypothetical protein